jgi:hypothetical protein
MVTRSPAAATALWPPDDTEESILGVDRHQLDIFSVRGGINEEAHRLAAGGPLAWQAISQILLLGCQRRDGSAYTVIPDVMVFPRPMDRTRGSYSLQADGPPVLVVEVASESTYLADLDVARGKAWTYQQAGVSEYLVLDPSARFVPEQGRGWRLVAGVYQPWETDDRGRWASARIGVAIGVEDGLAAVYGGDGRRRLREGEVEAALEHRYAEGQQAGQQAGEQEGVRSAVRRLARRRFGVVATLEARIDAADVVALNILLDRLLTATDPADL